MRWKFSSFLPLGLLLYRSICQDLLIPDYVPRSLEPMAFWKSLWWNIRYLWFQQKVCLRIGTMALSQLLEFYLVHNPYDTWESYLLYNSCIEYNMASATTSQLLGSHTCTPRDFALYVPFWQCWLVFWINCTLWQKKKKNLGALTSFPSLLWSMFSVFSSTYCESPICLSTGKTMTVSLLMSRAKYTLFFHYKELICKLESNITSLYGQVCDWRPAVFTVQPCCQK